MLKSGSLKIRLAAAVCLALGVGLVVFSYKDGQEYGETTEVERAPVTKPYPREREERELRTKNPREEFEAARKRGLTEGEVRGIVSEYLKMGITFQNHQDRSEEAYVEMGDKARAWYQDALVEGFGLDQVQKPVLRRMLQQAGKDDLVEFKDRLMRFRELRRKMDEGVIGLEAYGYALEFGSPPEVVGGFGLLGEDIRPRILALLDEEQMEMVGFFDVEGKRWIWVDGGSRTLDFGTSDCYGDLSDPFSESGVMAVAGKVFPLSMRQVECLGDYEGEAVSPHTPKLFDGGYLEQVRFLTAPQLKTLLLLDPQIAGKLEKELGQ